MMALQRIRLMVAIVATILAAQCAGAMPAASPSHLSGASPTLIVDRLELRSYQPYDTLQFGFRPEPPAERGVRTERPQIVMPGRRAPLIENGKVPSTDAARWYAFCADRFDGGLEPRDGPYGPYPLERRTCP